MVHLQDAALGAADSAGVGTALQNRMLLFRLQPDALALRLHRAQQGLVRGPCQPLARVGQACYATLCQVLEPHGHALTLLGPGGDYAGLASMLLIRAEDVFEAFDPPGVLQGHARSPAIRKEPSPDLVHRVLWSFEGTWSGDARPLHDFAGRTPLRRGLLEALHVRGGQSSRELATNRRVCVHVTMRLPDDPGQRIWTRRGLYYARAVHAARAPAQRGCDLEEILARGTALPPGACHAVQQP